LPALESTAVVGGVALNCSEDGVWVERDGGSICGESEISGTVPPGPLDGVLGLLIDDKLLGSE
jgi:hypothetical protein